MNANKVTSLSIGASAGNPKRAEARYAYTGINRVIHERARLSILTVLRTRSEPLSCALLARQVNLTRGNFDRHLAVLVKAGYVRLLARTVGASTRKHCAITSRGRESYRQHLNVLRQIYADVMTYAAGSDLDGPASPGSAGRLRP